VGAVPYDTDATEAMLVDLILPLIQPSLEYSMAVVSLLRNHP